MEGSNDKLVHDIHMLDNTETQAGKLSRKFKQDPFVAVGLAGLVGACFLGAFRFRRRPEWMSASQYLMQLRVIAQGCVVGSLALGIGYRLLKRSHIVHATESQD